MGTLYIVATPIGNLEDLSPRAVRIMDEAGLIAAEDTRRTRKLLSYFEINTPLTSYFEHNKIKKLDRILSALCNDDVALVSDGGMPTCFHFEKIKLSTKFISAGRLSTGAPNGIDARYTVALS